ncbi:hypothetical protein ABIE44_002734 [Marmoricola sp. OAE513]|uniref:hypothetical protein n=1 Tax=Marmoricola sp. OAE513 TaxID=2817894 RepID=UPI001AE73ECC
MTTMPAWLTEAADAVSAATDTAKVQTQVDTLTEAQRNLGAPLAKLTALSSATTAGGGTWFEGYIASPEVFEALKAAAKEPTQGNLGTLSRVLNSYVTAAENKAMADWAAYGSGRMGAVPDLLQLAGTLAAVASVAPLAAALKDVLHQLVPATNKFPTPAAFDLLDEAEARLNDLEAALKPDSVRQFFSAVARDGASLAMLTEDVRSWLASNGAEQSFRIVAGSPTEG